MLALTPTPDVSWPEAPKGEPGIGVFSIVLGKLKLPLSRSLHRLHTLCEVKLPTSFRAIAAGQFAKATPAYEPVQYELLSAAWKNGWTGKLLKYCVYCGLGDMTGVPVPLQLAVQIVAAGMAAPHATWLLAQPKATSMFAYAFAKVWPPLVIMYGTAFMLIG